MIPMWIKLRIRSARRKRPIYLGFPLILVWIPLLALLLLFAPFILLAGLVAALAGYGRGLLFFYPMLFHLLFSLSGFAIDIRPGGSDRQVTVKLF